MTDRAASPGAIGLVIFDCDGVLVDSEPHSLAVIVEVAAELGLRLDEAGAARFTGLRWSDVRRDFERVAGLALGADWPRMMQDRVVARMAGRLRALPGAREAIEAVRSLGVAVRVASNSSHGEMAPKFAWTGLADLVAGRCHSAADVGVGKPDPALFLAAAKAEGVAPACCLVVEDSVPGARAAAAAGMACLGLAPAGDGAALAGAGAVVIRALREVAPFVVMRRGLAAAA